MLFVLQLQNNFIEIIYFFYEKVKKGLGLLKEEWKDIGGYEGIYQISNLGRVRNSRNMILKPNESQHGYLKVNLHKECKRKTIHVHRLVAMAFIDNPNGYSEVNHIDEDKRNNNYCNLEWVSRLYNTGYGDRPRKVGRWAKANGGNTIYQHDRNNVLIREFRSLREAEKITGFCRQIISKHLNTGVSYKGFLWKR